MDAMITSISQVDSYWHAATLPWGREWGWIEGLGGMGGGRVIMKRERLLSHFSGRKYNKN